MVNTLSSLFLEGQFRQIQFNYADTLTDKMKPQNGRMWMILGGSISHDTGNDTYAFVGRTSGGITYKKAPLAQVPSALASFTFPIGYWQFDVQPPVSLPLPVFCSSLDHVRVLNAGAGAWLNDLHEIQIIDFPIDEELKFPIDKEVTFKLPSPLLVKQVGK